MGPGGPGCGLPLRLGRWAQGRSSQAPCAVSGRLNRPSLCRPKSPGPARAAGGARPPARQHGRRGQRGRGHNGLEETGGLAGATPGSQPLSTLGSCASRAVLLATERSRSKIIIQDLTPSTLLIDESDGRREAQRRTLMVTGTLGVLERAAIRGLTDLPSALARLQGTTFR